MDVLQSQACPAQPRHDGKVVGLRDFVECQKTLKLTKSLDNEPCKGGVDFDRSKSKIKD
jgi:hypothetical protein